ncbi:MAG: glycerol-3-phosphate acyltransferase [Chloroflexi bacterium]|nr:glycerol-3-phosphate acyltransferase [Chloroflexota bacterium]
MTDASAAAGKTHAPEARIAAAILTAWALGSVPVPWLVGRAHGIDLRRTGSGNAGASNVGESVSRSLLIPVGVAQIAQGLAGAMLPRATAGGPWASAAGGLAAVLAQQWNPWLRLQGGRGVSPAIGAMLALSPRAALPAFTLVGVAGMPGKNSAQSIAAALAVAPLAARWRGESAAVVAGIGALSAAVFVKRLVGNAPPAADLPRPGVYLTRLIFDRDTRDRTAWVRRNL